MVGEKTFKVCAKISSFCLVIKVYLGYATTQNFWFGPSWSDIFQKTAIMICGIRWF